MTTTTVTISRPVRRHQNEGHGAERFSTCWSSRATRMAGTSSATEERSIALAPIASPSATSRPVEGARDAQRSISRQSRTNAMAGTSDMT